MYNEIIKKIEIDLNTTDPYGYGQIIAVWYTPDATCIAEVWEDTLEEHEFVNLCVRVDYRTDFVLGEKPGDTSGMAAPCCMFVFVEFGGDILPRLFEVLAWEATLIASTVLSEGE